MKKSLPCLLLMLAFGAGARAAVAELRWDKLPPLPPSAGQTQQPGVAGAFAGMHGGVLIVAGGANFPDQAPWLGGKKVWWDDIWVMEDAGGANPRWVTDKKFKLPRRLGYGISVDTPEGVICVGGHDAQRCHADVFMLSWDAKAREVRRTALPALPEPLTFMAGAVSRNILYVAGGQTTMTNAVATKTFWALDLSKRGSTANFKWRALTAWPGPARVLPVAAVQRGPQGEEFFLFGGREPVPGKATKILVDAFAYDPATGRWRSLPNIGAGINGSKGVSVMGATAAPAGQSEIVIFGGDRGDLFSDLEAADLSIAEVKAKQAKSSQMPGPAVAAFVELKLAEKKWIYQKHPGFARELLAFDTWRNTWRITATAPFEVPVTTVAVRLGGAILIPSGEIKPGIRTPDVLRVRPVIK